MPILHLFVLALVQGITEFLPISSSAHLILVPFFTNWPDQGLVMDVAVHVGTLGAVMVYFWRDIWEMLRGLFLVFKGKSDPGARLAMMVVLGTIPVIVAGFLLDKYFGGVSRSIEVIGWATLGFGILLYISDKVGLTVRRIEHLGFGDTILIGLAQCLALIPGTSRSGITMTAARFLGFERPDTARFSMLLSIPTIMGAGVLKGLELYQSGDTALGSEVLQAVGLSFVSALIAITVMMFWLRRASFTPFVFYRILLGIVLLGFSYFPHG